MYNGYPDFMLTVTDSAVAKQRFHQNNVYTYLNKSIHVEKRSTLLYCYVGEEREFVLHSQSQINTQEM